MALEVLSTYPLLQDQNFYLDGKIEVTFSQEVHETSLTEDNVKLYIMPGWSGQVEIDSITKEGPKVIIVPGINLAPNQEYALWLRGDKNQADANLEGIASVLGQTMADHYQLNFKTGTKVVADDSPIETIDVTAETLEEVENQNEAEELLQSNDDLDIVGTYPFDGQTNVSGLTEVVIKFDQELAPVSLHDPIINPVSGLIDVQAEHYIYGYDVVMPEIEAADFEIVNDAIKISLQESDLSQNTQYTFTIRRERLAGVLGDKLPEDYIFDFGTKLLPLYASTDLVRMKGGKLIPAKLPNDTLLRYIHEASLWVYDSLNGNAPLEGPYHRKIVEATIMKTICDVASACSLNELRYIRDKQLADLRIVYDNVAVQGVIDDYCAKAQSALIALNPSMGIRSGVKSKSNTRYPGNKRHIHKYSKYSAGVRLNTPRGLL